MVQKERFITIMEDLVGHYFSMLKAHAEREVIVPQKESMNW